MSSGDESEAGELGSGNEWCRTGLQALGTAAIALVGTVAGRTLVSWHFNVTH